MIRWGAFRSKPHGAFKEVLLKRDDAVVEEVHQLRQAEADHIELCVPRGLLLAGSYMELWNIMGISYGTVMNTDPMD